MPIRSRLLGLLIVDRVSRKPRIGGARLQCDSTYSQSLGATRASACSAERLPSRGHRACHPLVLVLVLESLPVVHRENLVTIGRYISQTTARRAQRCRSFSSLANQPPCERV